MKQKINSKSSLSEHSERVLGLIVRLNRIADRTSAGMSFGQNGDTYSASVGEHLTFNGSFDEVEAELEEIENSFAEGEEIC